MGLARNGRTPVPAALQSIDSILSRDAGQGRTDAAATSELHDQVQKKAATSQKGTHREMCTDQCIVEMSWICGKVF